MNSEEEALPTVAQCGVGNPEYTDIGREIDVKIGDELVRREDVEARVKALDKRLQELQKELDRDIPYPVSEEVKELLNEVQEDE